MYIIYAVILLVLVLILLLTLKEEVMTRKGITHGIANKYWILREKRRFCLLYTSPSPRDS